MSNRSANPNRDTEIEFRGLTKQFDTVTAVDNLNLEIKKGAVFALLGPNGSGKTTTINMAAGLLTPTSGDLIISGHSILNHSLKVKQNTGVVPEEPALFRMLSIWEHLLITGPIYGLSFKETERRAEDLLKLLDLWETRDKNVDAASYGMKKKLAIAMALIHAPPVLFLDEPFKGIDPVSSRCVLELLGELSQKEVTIFLTTHLVGRIEQLIHQLGIIADGKMIHHAFVDNGQRSRLCLEEIFFQFIKPPPKPVLQWIN